MFIATSDSCVEMTLCFAFMLQMVEEAEALGDSLQESRWKRVPPHVLDPLSDHVVFQQFDLDSYTGQPLPGKYLGGGGRI